MLAFLAVTACSSTAQKEDAGLDGGAPDSEAGGLHAWTQVSNGLPPKGNAYAQSIAAVGTSLFVGLGVSGGAYLSTDNGASWAHVNNGLMPTGGLDAFAVRGTDLFAALGDIYRTTDNGTSWQALNSQTIATAVVVSGQTVVAGGAGLRYSTNNGATWANGANNNIPLVGALAFVGTSVFCGSAYQMSTPAPPSVQRSDDNGATWAPASTGIPNTLAVISLVGNGAQVLAGTKAGGGVYASTDNGATWTAKGTGLIAAGSNASVWTLAAAGGKIFAGTDDGVFVSTDSAASWTALDNGDFPQDAAKNVYGFAVIGSTLFAATYTTGVWRHAL